MTDICDVDQAVDRIDTEPPGIPEPEGPHLWRTSPIHERIVRGNRVWITAVDIDPGDGSEHSIRILSLGARIGAVTDRNPEIAVGTEMEISAVVADIGGIRGLLPFEEHPLRVGVGP